MKHEANRKAKVDALNKTYSDRTYKDQQECEMVKQLWEQEWNEWSAKEKKHTNPESPIKSDPQTEYEASRDNPGGSLCGPEVQTN